MILLICNITVLKVEFALDKMRLFKGLKRHPNTGNIRLSVRKNLRIRKVIK